MGSDLTRTHRLVSYGLPLAFLALFFVFPLGAIFERGLRSEGDASAWDVLTDPVTRDVLWFTVWLAALSTVLTVAAGLPGAYVLGRFDFPGRSVVRALVVVPFVLPTVVVALAFLGLLPERLERGPAAILAAHVFFNLAVVIRVVGTYWSTLNPRVSEAAATLGATPWRRAREVTLPLLAPALAAAAAIVFLFSFTSFGVVLILGGPQYATLEVEIYNQAVRAFDLHAAAVLSLVQLACVALAVAATMRLERSLSVRGELRSEHDVLRRARTPSERTVVGATLLGLLAFLGLPIAAVVERSLAVGGGHGFEAYRALTRPTSALLATPWEAVVNSIVYAAGATAVAVVVGGLAAFAIARPTGQVQGSDPGRGLRGRLGQSTPGHVSPSSSGHVRVGRVPVPDPRTWLRGTGVLDGLLMLPLGASAVMLGFGFVIAFDQGWLDFRSAPWIVPVAQALVAIPFVVRIVAPTLRAIEPSQREAAALLGASPGRVLREIDLPIAGRALAVAAGFAFAVSLGEFGATVFLARPDRPTLPVAIFRFLGRPGELNVAQAYALAVILMVVTAVSILLVERLAANRRAWF